MLVFWITAALFLAGALLLLLPALWRGSGPASVDARAAVLAWQGEQGAELEADVAAGRLDAAELPRVRGELERRAREEAALPAPTNVDGPARRTALAVALLLPVAAVSLYLLLGRPQAVTPAETAVARHSTSPEQVEQMVTALAERLKSQPDDIDGWTMLGRSYVALGRYRDAATALQRAIALAPADAGLLADLADVLGMAQGRKLAGEPARLIQRALDADPQHVKALALAGTAAFDAHDYEGARSFWQRLLAVVPADSPLARSVQGSIEQARQAAAGQEGAPAAPAAPTAAATAVAGEVTLAPELVARLSPGDTLFVFARAARGPRMPLAILRRPVGSLPAAFVLDDAMAMSPELRLSGFDDLAIGARISKSGNATAQAGDLVAQTVSARPGAKGLRLVIDRVQP